MNESNEQTIQVKTSTLRTVAILGSIVLLAGGIIWLTVQYVTGLNTVTFKAYVDGTDVVKISRKKLWIEHQTFQLPARMFVNNKKWSPVWEGKTSMPYDLNRAFKPRNPANVKLVTHSGRGPVSILEMPTPGNNETMVVQLDDGNDPGADWYEFTVSW